MGKYSDLSKIDDDFNREFNRYIKKEKDGSGIISIDKGTGSTCSMKENTEKECWCGFLTEDSLCSIHKRYGLDMLSYVCKVYPRIIVKTERGFEVALSFSCPTAAELMKNKNSIEFYYDPQDFSLFNINNHFNIITISKEEKKPGKEDYYEIEELLIDIIQLSNLDIETRLIIMGLFIEKVKADGFKEAKVFLEELDSSVLEKLKKIPSAPNFMMGLIRGIRFGKTRDEFERLYNIADNIITLKDNVMDFSEYGLEFINEFYRLYKPYSKEIANIYENYCINYIYSKKFYFLEYMDAYAMLLFFFTLIRFFSACTSIFKSETINEEHIISVIPVIESTIGHSGNLYNSTLDMLKKGGYCNSAHLISLINL